MNENSNNQIFNQNEENIESKESETEDTIETDHLYTEKVDKSSNKQNEIKGDQEDKPIIETNLVIKNETENLLEINNSDTAKLGESSNEKVEPLDEISNNQNNQNIESKESETEDTIETDHLYTEKVDKPLNKQNEIKEDQEDKPIIEINEPEIARKIKILSFSTIELTQITDKITQIYEYPFDFYNNTDNFNKILSKSSIIYNSKY